jgi:phosphoserine phosphatase
MGKFSSKASINQDILKPLLLVDVDGTLIHNDITKNRFSNAWQHSTIREKIGYGFLYIQKGYKYIKWALAQKMGLDAAYFQWNTPVIDWIAANRSAYSHTILISGSTENLVEQCAKYSGISWDFVLGSQADFSCIGTNKLLRLQTETGLQGAFVYMGNSQQDMPLWLHADCVGAFITGSKKYYLGLKVRYHRPHLPIVFL